jgi:transposase
MNYEAEIAQRDQKIMAFEAQAAQMQQKIIDLTYQLEKLQRMLFGKKAERFVSAPYDGPNLFSHLEPEQPHVTSEPVSITHVPAHDRKKSNHKGRTLLEKLPEGIDIEETVLEPSDKPEQAVLMGTEVQRKLAYKPGKFYIKQLNRTKYIDRQTGKIYIATKPNEALEKCEADPSLIADVLVSKFVDHIPEYRKQQQYKRDGVVIPSSTMNDWTHRTAEYLNPVAEVIKQSILATGYVQVDESTIKVMQKDKTKLGYMWVINSPQLRMSYFDFYAGRGSEVPKLMLEKYEGALQSDGYTAYEVLEKVNTKMTYFNCWAHARRKFEDSLNYNKEISSTVLTKIQKLYKVEQRCRDENLNDDERKSRRQEMSKPILQELKEYLDHQALIQISGTPISKAIGYTLNRWAKLIAYVDHSCIEIDNNLVENAIRPLALGRKNYLFAGSKNAAKNIGIYYTIFSSCKSLEVNPTNYLMWLLKELPNHSIKEIANFTPLAYKMLNLNV